MRSREVLSIVEGVYSRKWHIGKREGFRECERNGRWVWKKNECGS